MRKRTITNIADTIFWYSLYFLPVLVYVLSIISPNGITGATLDFAVFIENYPVFTNYNIIYTTLVEIFGVNGVMPLLGNSVLLVFSWFVSVYIIHLAVDFLLFIPKLCHKFMNDYTEGL